jgi:hypothetical protein
MSISEKYELITTLWYSIRENKLPNSQVVGFETEPFADAGANIRSLYTNPENQLGYGPLGNEFTISYTGVKTPLDNPNSNITLSSFKETFFINVPSGSIKGSSVYYDSVDGTGTTVDENIFTVSGGKGLFHDAVIAIIKYDNTGKLFGYAGARRIEVYKLKSNNNNNKIYIPGKGYEVLPNVFVEDGTILYPESTIEGKMQKIAFSWAYSYVGAFENFEKAIKTLNSITYDDSQLYYPSPFGYVTSRKAIIEDITGFAKQDAKASVWFPANGWCFDKILKQGVVGSDNKKKDFYNFTVEVQFRQTLTNDINICTNDNWSFFIDSNVEKFYQIKEWLDGRVRRLQAENVNNTPTLILDYNNINVIPWPPIFPGKEDCINPVIVKSGCVD